jgi:hypothetical protein
MAIYLIDGEPGAGKSLFLTKKLHERWEQGQDILPNYNLYFSEDNENIERWIDFREVIDSVGNENGKVIGVDEAYKIFNAQRWHSIPMLFAEKLAEHRHDGLDIYTATQNFGDLWNKVREKVHVWYHCRSIYRLPATQNVKPIFQIIRVAEKHKFYKNERAVWKTVSTETLFVSKFWTKKLYDTKANLKLSKFLCKLKIKNKKPVFKIVSREAIAMGKVKGW